MKKNIFFLNYNYIMATVFGSGLCPIMPGTIGSIVAILLWFILYLFLPKWLIWCCLLFLIKIAINICEQASLDIKVHDHKNIVLDELIGMWIILTVFFKIKWNFLILEFICFRFFDIIKPWPIKWFDKEINGGIGIILDDILAAVFTIIIIIFISYIYKSIF